jgi:hypothetical protein
VWSGDGPRRAETRTDAQGRFALRIATLRGIGEITAEASNFIGGRDAIDVADGDVEIRLIQGSGVRGHVRAADGSPVAGARIAAGAWIIFAGTTTTPPFQFDNLREGLTAPDGSYEFRIPRDGVRAWWADLLRAWSPVDGAMVETSNGADEGTAWRFDVSFAQPRTVSGRAVLLGSNRGLQGLLVSLVTDDFNSESVICAVTGADGRFSVRVPVDREASIRVEGDGYIAKTAKPGDGGDLLVEMQPDLPVTGVVRMDDGSPAILAAVTLKGPDGWTSEASMTDTGGRFVIAGVPQGEYVLLVDGAQGSPARVRAGTRGLEVVAPAPK